MSADPFVLAKRIEVRSALEANRRHGLVGQGKRVTSLGMHFIDVDGTPVLVEIEVNVPRLIAYHGKRLVKSKSGTARVSQGSVCLKIATLEGLEFCAAVRDSR